MTLMPALRSLDGTNRVETGVCAVDVYTMLTQVYAAAYLQVRDNRQQSRPTWDKKVEFVVSLMKVKLHSYTCRTSLQVYPNKFTRTWAA